MTAYQFRMPAGIPGDINRAQVCTVEPNSITLAGNPGAPTAYGVPVVIDATSGQARLATVGDARVYGLLARPFPTQDYSSINDPLGTGGVPPASGECDVMTRGYMTVLLSGAAVAVKGAPAYAWLGAAGGLHVLGGFEAAAGADTATSAPKVGGNTGTGTMGVVTPGAQAKTGTYTATMTSATAFNVTDPNGDALPAGTVGAAYSDPQLGFTITAGGTAFVAGDAFTISMGAQTLQMPNSYFMGAADSAGNVEIAFNI